MRAKDYRAQAREALRGSWRSGALIFALISAITAQFGLYGLYEDYVYRLSGLSHCVYYTLDAKIYPVFFFPCDALSWLLLAASVALRLLIPLLMVGRYCVAGAILRGEKPRLKQVFPWALYGKVLAMYIVYLLLCSLQMLLLVVPGIIAGIRYQAAFYLMAENPSLGPIEALRESRVHMRGHKGASFCLGMSFAGWMLLAAIPTIALDYLGLSSVGTIAGWLCFSPLSLYMYMTFVVFFRDIFGAPTNG